MADFTPVSALAGGVLIGLGASLLLLAHGRVAGISGLYGQLFRPGARDRGLRLAFVLGLVAAGAIGRVVSPASIGSATVDLAIVAVAGLLVGYGTRLGNGCTSGHGVCGMARLSPRSIAATVVFIGFGAATVYLLRLVGAIGGTP